MSLLLEALKKAEKAKEEAQRKARGEAGGPTELRLEGDAPAPSPPAAAATASARPDPVMTRDQLPDIRQPLEIEREPGPAPAKPAAASPEPPPRSQARAEAQAAERASARKVFEAKFKEPNPRLPFYITLGALGVFALGTVAYFWIQLRPAPALVNANPPRPSGEAQVAAAETRPGTMTPGSPQAAVATPTPSAIPGLPASAATPAPAKAPPQASPTPPAVRAPVQRPAERTLPPERPLLKPIPQPRPTTAEPEVSTSRGAPQVHPKVSSAYAAYLAGDLGAARADYEQALREEPTNRDAALGLAAVDVRAGRFEAAEAAYLRLLQADPRDANAQAALIALRGSRADPVATESRVKSMIADNPGAHVLNFTLGNQLAQQGRWAEAQQQYFKAFSAEPDNADFAYNLAVSLDHLRQPKLALEYYRRALELAKARGARFDVAAAETRAAQLGR